mgnify:CR=1 FL=1
MAKKKPSKLDIDLSGLQQTLRAQFTGLDPNDPTQWPSLPRYLLLAFISVAVVAALWFSWLSSFQDELEAERAEGVPSPFTKIHMRFLVTGKELKEAQVKRAVELSATKYCSASIMLEAGGVEITHSYEIREA